jgi:hypothetical protein
MRDGTGWQARIGGVTLSHLGNVQLHAIAIDLRLGHRLAQA